MTDLATTRTPSVRCPACGHVLDAATSTEGDHAPAPGDLSVCAYCATVLTFDDGLRVEVLPQEQLDALRPEERAAVLRAVAVARRLQPRR